jgi:meiotically up-regulated gene 157 (Mug157) protein
VFTFHAGAKIQQGHVFEGKYELDSLMHALKLSYGFFNATSPNDTCWDLNRDLWLQAAAVILDTVVVQQRGSMEEFTNPAYLFSRQTNAATDTLMNQVHAQVTASWFFCFFLSCFVLFAIQSP